MDENVEKRSIHKKIMATRDDYVDNKMFDPDEAIAAAVKKKKFLLKTAFRRSRTFSRTMNPNITEPKINYCPN